MLVIDAANVIGSRPDGWWRDRPAAARRFVEQVRAAVGSGAVDAPVTIVLEGRFREGVDQAAVDGVEVVHAPGDGDDTIADLAELAELAGPDGAVVVTADRALAQRVRAVGGDVVGPHWLLDRLG